MRLKSYLNEAALMVSFKDLPDWVKKILVSKKIRKDIRVEIGNKVSISGNWHDANVRGVYLFKGGKVASQKAVGGLSMFDKPGSAQAKAKQGFDTELNPGEMILTTNTYPKGAKLYAHPMDMKPMLDEPASDELSPEEVMVLVITRGLKPFARRAEAARYGVNYNKVRPELIKKGFLMKNGALNKKAKNWMISNGYDRKGPDTVAREMKLKDRMFG